MSVIFLSNRLTSSRQLSTHTGRPLLVVLSHIHTHRHTLGNPLGVLQRRRRRINEHVERGHLLKDCPVLQDQSAVLPQLAGQLGIRGQLGPAKSNLRMGFSGTLDKLIKRHAKTWGVKRRVRRLLLGRQCWNLIPIPVSGKLIGSL